MIAIKKQTFFKENLSETIGEPNELWESLKSLDMPHKKVISNFNGIEEGNTLTHDNRLVSKILKNFFLNLAESLLIKLPKSLYKFNLKSVIQYYSSFGITVDFGLVSDTEKQGLKIMQDIKSFKAAGVDKLLRRLLNDGANIPAKLVSALRNLLISWGVLPIACKFSKLRPIFKKGKKTYPSN